MDHRLLKVSSPRPAPACSLPINLLVETSVIADDLRENRDRDKSIQSLLKFW